MHLSLSSMLLVLAQLLINLLSKSLSVLDDLLMLLSLLFSQVVVVQDLLQQVCSLGHITHLQEQISVSEVLLHGLVIGVKHLEVLRDPSELVDPDLVLELRGLVGALGGLAELVLAMGKGAVLSVLAGSLLPVVAKSGFVVVDHGTLVIGVMVRLHRRHDGGVLGKRVVDLAELLGPVSEVAPVVHLTELAGLVVLAHLGLVLVVQHCPKGICKIIRPKDLYRKNLRGDQFGI